MQAESISLRKLCRIASKKATSRVKNTTALCTRCGAIRLRLEPNLPASDDLVFLGSLKNLEERQDCALCRFVLRTLSAGPKSAGDKAETHCVLNTRPGCGESFALECRHGLSSSTTAWIRIDCPPGILQGFTSSPCPVRQLDSNELKGKVERSLLINPQKIRNWLAECETWHQECAAYQFPSHKNETQDLLLIDVVDNMLVDANQDSRYLALSYVMGGFGGATVLRGSWSKYDYVRTQGALDQSNVRLPETLRDAMELTRSIGERYLWCDALCVFEDGESQRIQQLAQMDIIYSRALFTIIALSGTHGDEPLPGIRPDSRGPSVLAEELCGGLRFLSWAPSLGSLVKGSRYESRGWTFQERLLSRRCLFITQRQVFFQCAHHIVREDEEVLGHPTHAMARSIGQPQEAGLGSMLNAMDSFSLYSYLVHNYTDRQLTNPQDILDGFKGITAALEGPFGANFVDGLLSSYFRYALMWMPQHRIRRRFIRPKKLQPQVLAGLHCSVPMKEPKQAFVTVPTWSWGAWVGQVRYSCTDQVEELAFNGGQNLSRHEGPQSFAIISMLETRQRLKISWEVAYQQGIGPNITHYHEWKDQNPPSPGSELFFQHFALYGFFLIDALLKHFHYCFPNLSPLWQVDRNTRYRTTLTELYREVEDFLQDQQWFVSKLPFSSMPSFEEFRRMIDCYSAPNIHRLNCWPFTHISQEKHVAAPVRAQGETPGPGADTAEGMPPAWPFEHVPHRSSLTRIPPRDPMPKDMVLASLRYRPRLTALGAWVFISPFDPNHLLGGQLFSNTFSRSLQYTTQDGSIQCDVEQLSFSTESGVAAGQQGQPATVLRNDLSKPYGVAMDHEEDIWQRCLERQCHLVFLYYVETDSSARGLAFMLVAEREPQGCYERLAVAHLSDTVAVGSRLKRYEYICIM